MLIEDKYFDLIEPKETRKVLRVSESGEVENVEMDVYELLLDKKRGKCWLQGKDLQLKGHELLRGME